VKAFFISGDTKSTVILRHTLLPEK
jgi:hypothetical protein